MSDSVTVRVPGLARLGRDLRKMGADLTDLKAAHERAGTIVAAAGAARAPRRSGKLAGSGRASRAVARVSVMFGSARIPYAGPIHWGWASRGIEGDPFVVEAAQATQPEWLGAFEDGIDQAVETVAGRIY